MLYISFLFGLHACGAAIIQHVIVALGLFDQALFYNHKDLFSSPNMTLLCCSRSSG